MRGLRERERENREKERAATAVYESWE